MTTWGNIPARKLFRTYIEKPRVVPLLHHNESDFGIIIPTFVNVDKSLYNAMLLNVPQIQFQIKKLNSTS